MKRHRETILLLLTCIVMVLANYWVFMVVPSERLMGAVQRIFYFHVGSAIASYFSIALLLLGSFWYLAQRKAQADALMVASAEVGFVLCSVVLATGMIWGHSAWNTWFRWEPRLVTFVMLWLILLALNLLRAFADPAKVAVQTAVLGILSAVNVPLVIFSVKLLPQAAQLHPQILENRGLRHPSFSTALMLATLAMILLQFTLIWLRMRVAKLEQAKNS